MPLTTGSVLDWAIPQPGRHCYELKDGDLTLASLEWKSPGSTDAEGRAGERRLLFRKKGLFFRQTIISEADTGFEIATFRFYGGDKGILTYSDGYRLKWRFDGIPESKWFFTTEKGSELLCFTVPKSKKAGTARVAAEVGVLREVDEKSVVLLSVIGWYNVHGILAR